MTGNFGPWSTAIHDHGKAQLAVFWKRRFRSLAVVSSPRSSSRVSTSVILVAAAISFCPPTVIAERAQAEKEPAPAGRRANADQPRASNKDHAARRAERLKQLEKNFDPETPQRNRPDIEKRLSIEFVDYPAAENFEFLGDAYRVPIFLSRGADRDRVVNLEIVGKPLRDSLDMVCAHLQLEWDTDGYLVYVGPKPAVKKFRRLVGTREDRRGKYPAALAQPLRERVDLVYDDLPLKRALRYLSEVKTVPIEMSGDSKLDREHVWFPSDAGSLPLDVVLDLISVECNASWEITEAGQVLVKDVPGKSQEDESALRPRTPTFIAHEVSTELQRVLLPAETRVFVAVDGRSVVSDDANDQLLAAIERAIRDIKNKNGSVLFAVHFTARDIQAVERSRRQHREAQLRELARGAGFRDARVRTSVSNANLAWEDRLERGAAQPGDAPDREEKGAGGDRAEAYPVRTPLSRYLTGGADAVIDVPGPIRRGEIDAELRRSIEASFAELKLSRKDRLELRADQTDLSRSDVQQLADDVKKLAESQGFSGSQLVMK